MSAAAETVVLLRLKLEQEQAQEQEQSFLSVSAVDDGTQPQIAPVTNAPVTETQAAMTLGAGALLHLLQLASPSLPIGGFSYSQGLESAMATTLVSEVASARNWLLAMLHQVVARFEAPLLWRLWHAWQTLDAEAVAHWNEMALAGRDTAEFRAETLQMGYSLARLCTDLELADAPHQALLASLPEVALPTALALAAVALQVPAQAALLGLLFSWAENQVLVCVKSLPLGQVAGQRLLLSLQPELVLAAATAQTLADEELCNWSPGLSLLSMQHEVQFSRMYRS